MMDREHEMENRLFRFPLCGSLQTVQCLVEMKSRLRRRIGVSLPF